MATPGGYGATWRFSLYNRAMQVTRRRALKTLAVGGAGLVAGTAGYGTLYERRDVRIVESTLPVRGLPQELAGLRIGFLTDAHHGSYLPRDDLERAVGLLASTRPDLVALGGDYVTWRDRTHAGSFAEAISALRPPHGVFAVLGNHDDGVSVPRELARNGVTVLDDARTRVVIGGVALDIAGVDFWTRKPEDVRKVLAGARQPVIMLAHDPRRLTIAAELGVPLLLSGHTHGGQIVLPGLGAIAARKYPVAAGMLVRDGTTLFVSRGVGTVFVPCRINCPPEVAVLTLAVA